MEAKKKKQITIITPLLNEEENVRIFYDKTSSAVQKIPDCKFLFMYVDDGSGDNSWKEIVELAKVKRNVSGIKLSRNFGSHTALLAGITLALKNKNTDAMILTTIDLQNPPELVKDMVVKFQKEVRVVWGIRAKREDRGIQPMFSALYHNLVKRFALNNMPEGGVDFGLIDRKVAQDVIDSQEKNTSLFGLILWLGYQQEFIPYTRKKIPGRKSRWSLVRKIKLVIDTFVSFSYAPIWLVTYLGFSISALGFIYGLIIALRRIIYGTKIEGWSSLMLVTLLLFGILFIMLGIVAEYLWRTFDVSRKRPIYLIDKEINL